MIQARCDGFLTTAKIPHSIFAVSARKSQSRQKGTWGQLLSSLYFIQGKSYKYIMLMLQLVFPTIAMQESRRRHPYTMQIGGLAYT